MQFFVLCIIVLAISCHWKQPQNGWPRMLSGLAMSVLILLASMVTNTAIAWNYEYKAGMNNGGQNPHGGAGEQEDLYLHPWNRVGPYAIGMGLAFVLAERRGTNNPWKVKTGPMLLLLILAFATLAVTVYAPSMLYQELRTAFQPYKNNWSDFENVFYLGASSFGFSMGLAVIVVACVAGQGSIPHIISTFLSSPLWLPMSRLTYGVYLVHPAVIFGYYSMEPRPMIYSDRHVAVHFIFFTAISYGAAVVLHLLIERPAGALLDLFLPPVLSPKSIWKQDRPVKEEGRTSTSREPSASPGPLP